MRLKKIIEAEDAVAVIHDGDVIAFAGELRVPQKKAQAVELSERKIIARRAALELSPNCVINVGVGTVPDQVRLRRLHQRMILDAVDALLGPLGGRVHSVVNYERFSCDDDVFDLYVDAVKYVEQTYYIDVKRYTSGAFLRHKLGSELAKRQISSEVLGSPHPAPAKR